MAKPFVFLRRLGLIIAWGLLVAGCERAEPVKFHSTDIFDAGLTGNFRLTDHFGKARSMRDFRGKVVIQFFGYTHCPDVCPTTMAKFQATMKELGRDSARVQVLFVTLDPQRDTQPVLAHYVRSFHPLFLGLYGTQQDVESLAQDLKVAYEKQQGKSDNEYDLNHTSASFIYDTDGKLRLLANQDITAAQLAGDIRALLGSAR